MELTNIIGKQVFCLYKGEVMGTISGAVFKNDFTKVLNLRLFDLDENDYEIKFSSIKAMGDYILISNESQLFPSLLDHQSSPFFMQVIDHQGNDLGKIVDCQLDKNGIIENFVTDKQKTLLCKNMYIRKNFVYYTEKSFIAKNYMPRGKKTMSLENIKVGILQNNFNNFAPTKIKFNADNMIGKIAKDTLLGINNEVIIRANQTITNKTILDATNHNRLNQLYFLAN